MGYQLHAAGFQLPCCFEGLYFSSYIHVRRIQRVQESAVPGFIYLLCAFQSPYSTNETKTSK